MAKRGMQILTWVYLAKRLLSIEELLFALAIEDGHSDRAEDIFPSRKTFLNSCLGLIVLDEQSTTVRLFHKSLQDFLDGKVNGPKNKEATGQTVLGPVSRTHMQ